MIVLEQCLNGIQLGATLFLVAAGLTLVFGIMNLVNLAHGSLYMVGAYVSATVYIATGSFALAAISAIVGTLLLGLLIEIAFFRRLYDRDHLDQVLVTFGLIMIFNEAVRTIWGPGAIDAPIPAFLAGNIQIAPGFSYPIFRLAITIAGVSTAAGLYLVISHSRLGMLIRAGASDRVMVGALGVNIRFLNTIVFGVGSGLAALAGVLAGPIFSVQPGMGDDIIILAFVVVIIGGLGSVRGAFLAAMIVGLVDTLGRAFLRSLLVSIFGPMLADSATPAIASMLIYITMAAVLFLRPQGLFPVRTR